MPLQNVNRKLSYALVTLNQKSLALQIIPKTSPILKLQKLAQAIMNNIEEKLEHCESLILYTFNNKLLLCEALQTSGYGIHWRGAYAQVPKNTRLAVYGDTALNMAYCSLWYPKHLDKGAIISCL
jgi:hypothetical protein